MPRFFKPTKFLVTLFLLASFICALAWAAAKDPFQRIRFSLTGAGGETIEGLAVIAKPRAKRPVVIYLHDASENLQRSGLRLRQLAELGLAAVAIEYNRTNEPAFDAEFTRVLEYACHQSWARSNTIAWFGYGLGAQRALSYLAGHPQSSPQLLVWLAGGSSTGKAELLKQSAQIKAAQCRFLLVHGRNDEVFSARECEELASILRTQGNEVELNFLDGLPRQFGQERDVIHRAIAERIAAEFGVAAEYSPRAPITWYLWLAVIAMAGWLLWVVGQKTSAWCFPSGARLSAPAKWFYVFVTIVALVALAQTALHLVLPRLAVSPTTIKTARAFLVRPEWRDDFDYLAADADWQSKPLRQLLQHVELAGLQRKQFYADLDYALYREFVLSPRIGVHGPQEWGWRRKLWESFYPRVRKGDDPMQAAQTVARYLRERIGTGPAISTKAGVEAAWETGSTDSAGFTELHVAALRSVGIAARLSAEGEVELWSGGQWLPAPQPLLKTGFPMVSIPEAPAAGN